MVCAHHGSILAGTAPSSTNKLSSSLLAGSLAPSPFRSPHANRRSLSSASTASSLGGGSTFDQPTQSFLISSRSLASLRSAPGSDSAISRRDESHWDTGGHLVDRRTPWHSHSRGYQVPWQTETRSTQLSVGQLEPRKASWVVSDTGGTHSQSLPRPITALIRGHPLTSRAGDARARNFGDALTTKTTRPRWDRRYPVAHSIDANPVELGMRNGLCNRTGVLCSYGSPSRRWEYR